jgi:hypothetical protein
LFIGKSAARPVLGEYVGGVHRLATAGAVIGLVILAVAPATAQGPEIDTAATANERAVRGAQTRIGVPAQPTTATYRVTFNARWTSASHPTTTPNDAHFSNPVLAVHSTPGAMFDVGAPTSPGVQDVAEFGRTATLLAELRSNSTVTDAQVTAGVPAPAIGSRSFDITATQDADLVSLVTMLAPSSDWFVGVRNFDLFKGVWLQTTTVDAGNYDAGTSSGDNFGVTSRTGPGVVSGPVDPGYINAAAENPFATITITRTG